MTQNRLTEILAEADICRLIALGAPIDEYDQESVEILKHLDHCKNVSDVQKVLRDVFMDLFERAIDIAEAEVVADKIWKER